MNIRRQEKRKVWIDAECQGLCISVEKKAPSERGKWPELFRCDENVDPSRKARVCSLYFMDGKPLSKHPFPELFEYNKFKKSRKVSV